MYIAVLTIVVLVTNTFLQSTISTAPMVVAVGRCVAVGRTRRREETVIAFADPFCGTVAVPGTCRRRVAISAAVIAEIVFGTPALAFASALSVPAAGQAWVAENAATGVGGGPIEVRCTRITSCAMVVTMADARATGAAFSMPATCRSVIAVHITCLTIELCVTRLTMQPYKTVVAQTLSKAIAVSVPTASFIRSAVCLAVRPEMMWPALIAKGTEMLLVALTLTERGAPSMATTSEVRVTEFPAGWTVVIVFANAAVMTDKVKVALAIAARVADAVPAAGHARAAVFVARPCWIEVD